MSQTIRKTYPKDFSIGVMVIIFGLVFFLSGQLFASRQAESDSFLQSIYVGQFLVSVAVLVMVLILWEEILFPVKVKPVENGVLFRNHGTKLVVQAIIYLIIPAIIIYLYFTFEISTVRFFVWAGICLILPVLGALKSGINNYNDFLQLTTHSISYKDNDKEGDIPLSSISSIKILTDEKKYAHKLELKMKGGHQLIIDIDEMELEAFLESIENYIEEQYTDIFVK